MLDGLGRVIIIDEAGSYSGTRGTCDVKKIKYYFLFFNDWININISSNFWVTKINAKKVERLGICK